RQVGAGRRVTMGHAPILDQWRVNPSTLPILQHNLAENDRRHHILISATRCLPMWRIVDAPLACWSSRPLAGIAVLLLTVLASTVSMAQEGQRQALIIDIDGAIGPATADHVASQLEGADPARVGLVILRLDTPGGLDTAMRRIIRAELASPIPVV